MTYAHLDPLVYLAFRLPHLPFDELPVLADYDEGHVLKKRTWTLEGLSFLPEFDQALILFIVC